MASVTDNLFRVSFRTLILMWVLFPFTLIGLITLVIFRDIYPPLELNIFRHLIDLLSTN
ncbi:MAG: hypothetical protein GX020_06935 [Firmicutes bacterium]|nr:hypothetical protein [Bacillota bacterium]